MTRRWFLSRLAATVGSLLGITAMSRPNPSFSDRVAEWCGFDTCNVSVAWTIKADGGTMARIRGAGELNKRFAGKSYGNKREDLILALSSQFPGMRLTMASVSENVFCNRCLAFDLILEEIPGNPGSR